MPDENSEPRNYNLRDVEEHFAQLVAGVQDHAIFLLSPEGFVKSWNAGAARIKGYAADEIIGKHFSEFYTPESKATGWPDEELRRAKLAGRFEDEGWRVRKDGGHFWANVVIAPFSIPTARCAAFSRSPATLPNASKPKKPCGWAKSVSDCWSKGSRTPVLPRQRRRLDPRARPRQGTPLRGQLHLVARAEAGPPRAGGEDRVGAPPHPRARARMGALEPDRASREVEGAHHRLREAPRRRAVARLRRDRDPHSARAPGSATSSCRPTASRRASATGSSSRTSPSTCRPAASSGSSVRTARARRRSSA